MRNIIIVILATIISSALIGYPLENYGFGILIGVVIGLVLFIILTKRVMKEFDIVNKKAQKALQNQKFERAINIYKGSLALSKKSPFIKGQVYSMIGMLYYVQKQFEEAKPYLSKASFTNWMAKAMLAVIYYREKNDQEMCKILDKLTASHKKEGLVWGLYAYLLNSQKKREEAIKILEEGNQKLKEQDERIKTNLIELKNKRRMKMKGFGEAWYQFLLENPPRRMIQQNQPAYMRQKKNAIYR